MININPVLKLLKTKKDEMAFEDIFASVKDKLTRSIEDENELRADLYVSMLDTKLLIMVGGNKWGLRENYSMDQIAQIETIVEANFEELENREAAEETQEFKIK